MRTEGRGNRARDFFVPTRYNRGVTDGNEPATKQDLANLRTELKADQEQLRSELKADQEQLRSELKADQEQLRSEFHHGFDDLKETMRDIQTDMLKAFYNFAESNNKRIGENEMNEAAIRSRVETLERRVTELEQRLNIPPAA